MVWVMEYADNTYDLHIMNLICIYTLWKKSTKLTNYFISMDYLMISTFQKLLDEYV
jgi:hypothetical protein